MGAPDVDVDALPPTQYLILEVLAARYRLGEQFWTFPKRLQPHLDALYEHGLIFTMHGVAPKSVRAGLTYKGRSKVLLDSYMPPAARGQ